MENQETMLNEGYDENVVANEESKVLSATKRPPLVDPSLSIEGDEENNTKYQIVGLDIVEHAEDLRQYSVDVRYGGKHNGAENLTSEEKDQLWGEMQDKLIAYQEAFSKTTYKLFFTNDEVKQLSAILNNHIEYDMDTIFWGVKFETEMQELVKHATEKRGNGLHTLDYTYTQMQVLLQLFKSYKFTGIGVKGRIYYNILLKFAHATNINQYLVTLGENASKDLQEFIASIASPEEFKEANEAVGI
jgi:hypothetical protein